MLEDLGEDDTDEEDLSSISSIASSTASLSYASSVRPRSPSPTPSHESVVQTGGSEILPPTFHLALGLWCEKIGLSRMSYVMHREVVSLLKASAAEQQEDRSASELAEALGEDVIESLPLKLDTLKKRIRRHMPLLKIYRKALPVIIHKQPSIAAKLKGNYQRQRIERMAWQYWFDPMDLITTILSATKLRAKMHFGMAHLVDNPTELWHSNAWGSSIRAVSGDICRTRRGDLIIPGDILRIKSGSDADTTFKYGRVIFIGRNYTENALIAGEVTVTIQSILSNDDLMLDDFDIDRLDNHELFLLDDETSHAPISSIDQHIPVHMDREYDGDEEQFYNDGRFYIRRVLSLFRRRVRPLRQLHPTRGELEVEYFGRDWLAEAFSKPLLSLPCFLFVDDFGVHRNMYRSLKAFYLIPANLPYKERRILANVFTVTLGPHGAHLKDVIGAFGKAIRALDRGQTLDINGEQTTVCAFIMAFLGDMPQQADNAGFSRHNAVMGCRTCLCSKSDRDNLNYDVIVNGRYHWDTVRQRDQAQDLSKKEQKAFVQETGIKIESSPMTRLAPSLDLVLSRPYDSPHSEWRGISRIMHSFLLSSVLSKKGSSLYLKAFQTFRYPPGWPHIQSPISHIWSWSLSEAGRASLLMPLILRSHATIRWYRLPFLQAADTVFNVPEENATAVRAIVKAFGQIALSNSLVGNQQWVLHSQLQAAIMNGRASYQKLVRCAIGAAEGFGRQDDEDSNEEMDDQDEAMLEVLSTAADSADADSTNDLPTQATKTRGRKPTTSRFKKLLSLPNVHVGLHLGEMAAEYATVMNLNVLAGEMKHM